MAELKTLLKFDNISLSFGGIKALKNVSFDVKEKSITSIIGPNGAGKTSVFNCISGIYTPDSGNILFEDKNPSVQKMLFYMFDFQAKPSVSTVIPLKKTFTKMLLQTQWNALYEIWMLMQPEIHLVYKYQNY